MTRRPSDAIRATVAAIVAVVIVVGVPLLLVEWIGWPLPTELPSAGEVTAALRTGLAADHVAKALAVVVWIGWGQFTIAFTAETISIVRNRPVPSPALLPGTRHAAAQLISTIMLVATTTTMARPALALEPMAAPVVEQSLETTAPAPPDPDTSEVAVKVVTVAPRDSWWRIAETHLGDGLRWREIRDLNIGRTVADGTTITAATEVIHPGWELAIPEDSRGSGEAATQTWTVERGDNLWDIAAHTLLATNGHQPDDGATATYWRELIDTNRQHLMDPTQPDHIVAGQQLHLPTISQPADEPRSQPPPKAQERTAAATGHAARPDQGTGSTDDRTSTSGSPSGAATTADPADGADPDGSDTAADERADLVLRTDEPLGPPEEDAAALLPPALAATAIIGAGVLEMLRRRRRAAFAARRAGMRYPTPHPRQQAAESRLAAAAARDTVLDDLWGLLRTIPDDAQPALVRVNDGHVTLTFDHPPDDPPQPWQGSTDHRDAARPAWTAELGETGPVRSVGLPLLVTLGLDESGGHLLANVAAGGQLDIVGHPGHVTARLRTMTLEVATSPIAHSADILVLGDDMLEQLDNVHAVDDPEPEIAACVAAVARGIHPEDRTPVLIVCHDDRDLHIPTCPDLGLIRARDPVGEPAATLELAGPDHGLFKTAEGLECRLALPEVDASVIDSTLTALDHPVLLIDEPNQSGPSETTDDRAGASAADDDVASAETTDWCQVRILGPVDVLIDGHPVDGLTPKLLELLLFLATHRDSATPERVQDALWPGIPPRSAAGRARKTFTRLRAALGDGPTGEPLVPHRPRGGDGRLELSCRIATDLDRALGQLELARREPEEDRLDRTLNALNDVRGEPFQTVPLSWTSEVTTRAIVALQDAADRAARLAMTRGRFDDGIDALRAGLRLMPSTEALYLTLAELEIARGRPEAVAEIRRQFLAAIDDDGIERTAHDRSWRELDPAN